MSLLSTTFTSNLLLIVIAITTIVFLYLKWKLTYWNSSGLPTLSPVLFFGDGKDTFMGRISLGEITRKFYTEFKSKGHKHGAVFMGTQPTYVPVDPEIIKHIMQTDFSHFVNRGSFANEENDPLTAHLFSLENEKWRNLRVKLTPTFTSGKMKMMFDTIANCCINLKDILNEASQTGESIDAKEVLTRLTTDIIGSCAFGLECNSLKNPEAEFRQNGKKIFAPTALFRFKVLLIHALPHCLLKAVGLKLLDSNVEKFFMNVVKDTVEYRERNNIQRKDFMQLLIQLKNHKKITDSEYLSDDLENIKSEDKALTMNELAAQAFVFFLAGFDTSSTTMAFAMYEIAANETMQEKIRREINTISEKHNGKLTYDGVMEMSYLDNVLQETLRKYPPLSFLDRICNKDYVIPKTNITLKKGVKVSISVSGLHNDPEYYPNPEKFDPDRFLEKNKNKRPAITWIPFGEGPRICIGLRFGMLQSKIGLVKILKDYKIKIGKETQLPLTLDKKSFVTAAEGGIWLKVEKLK